MISIRQCSETRFPQLKINGKIHMLIEKKALIAHRNARYHWNCCNSEINIIKSVPLGKRKPFGLGVGGMATQLQRFIQMQMYFFVHGIL